MMALVGGTIITGTGEDPIIDGVLLIEGERIRGLGTARSLSVPRDARKVDAQGCTVMPGLIDCHVHIDHRPTYDPMVHLQENVVFAAIRGWTYAREMLRAGITSFRDAGSAGLAAIGLAQAIDSGIVPGPRVVACGQLIAMTGAGKYGSYLRPELDLSALEVWVSGVEEVRRAVRRQLGLGARAVKMMASGLLGGELGGQDPQLSIEELRAGVEEAHLQNRHVFVHSHGTQGCRNAVLAGVDSVDHGTFLDGEVASLMARNGTYLVPTLSYWARMEAHLDDESVPLSMRTQYRQTGRTQYAAHRESVRCALEAGVRIAMGTDAGELEHDKGAFELEALVHAGLTPMQAIVAGTSYGAALLRLRDVGRLEQGKIADLLLLRGDPLSDIRLLQDKSRIRLVLKGGVVCCDRDREERECSTT